MNNHLIVEYRMEYDGKSQTSGTVACAWFSYDCKERALRLRDATGVEDVYHNVIFVAADYRS